MGKDKDRNKSIDNKDKDEIRRIYRSKEDKMIGGVCGGIAEFMNVDPVWVRLVAILLIFFDGVGLLIYIILWILIPENPYQEDPEERKKRKKNKNEEAEGKVMHKEIHKNKVLKKSNDKGTGRIIIGGVLIVVGMLFFFRQFYSWVSLDYLWPVVLIGIGLVLLLRR